MFTGENDDKQSGMGGSERGPVERRFRRAQHAPDVRRVVTKLDSSGKRW